MVKLAASFILMAPMGFVVNSLFEWALVVADIDIEILYIDIMVVSYTWLD